jgi:mannose-6-phosphate isomerase-like protein (cupin superfamily)
MSDYAIISADDAKDAYAGSDVPGEFRRLTPYLESEQLSLTLIRIPAHSDFEQSTGHYHDLLEEVYIITKGELTMRFNDDIVKVKAGSAVRVAPKTVRSHRNEGDEAVDMWAISKKIDERDGHKVDEFWGASLEAKQTK